MVKRLEDVNHEIDVAKEVLDSMPKNNAKNLAAYKKKVQELKEEYTGMRDEVLAEIRRRASKTLNTQPSPRLELVKKELQDYEELSLFNPVNTPFEKLGFDTLLYSITHYYKTDLASVNADIKEAFARFEAAGVPITENDFIYSNYARKYIRELLKDDNIDRMKDVFEDLHWKCPDVISHIETSLRIIFNKNIKSFEKYIETKQKDIVMDNLSYDDYVIKRNNLARELNDLELYDEAVIIKRFMDGELILSDFSPVSVSKCYSRFLGDNCDVSKGRAKKDDFRNLYHNLNEYKYYLKFKYLLDDFRKKYAERDAHKDDLARVTKEINTLVDELVKLTSEINEGSTKGFLFFRKKVDIEQHYLTVNEKVKELDAKYEEYDKALVYSKLNEFITDTSTIYDVFRFVVSYKGYLRACIKENVEDADIKKVKETVKEFDAFLSDPNISVLNNLAFTVENDVALIIIDHYKLLEISLNMDELTPEGIDGLKQALEIINISNSLEEYDLSIDYIENLFEAKKIINSNK